MRLLRQRDSEGGTMSSEDPEQKKKVYEKPTLSEVPLRPEEAVLGSCKTVMVSGPAMADCSNLMGCSSLGS
jgi:hypothetical protein